MSLLRLNTSVLRDFDLLSRNYDITITLLRLQQALLSGNIEL